MADPVSTDRSGPHDGRRAGVARPRSQKISAARLAVASAIAASWSGRLLWPRGSAAIRLAQPAAPEAGQGLDLAVLSVRARQPAHSSAGVAESAAASPTAVLGLRPSSA